MSKDMCSAAITRLKELTSKLPPFPPQIEQAEYKNSYKEISAIAHDGYREYQLEGGDCFSWFIHRSGNDIAIHRWFISGGAIFPEHAHEEREMIVIYAGTMVMHKEGTDTILNKGDSIMIEPGVVHSSTYPEDCKFITLMIPPSKEFPYGPR